MGDSRPGAAAASAFLAGVIGYLAAAVALVGLTVGYAQRGDRNPNLSVGLLVAATALAGVSAVCGVAAARHPAGLRWPDGVAGSWPVWPWWWVIGMAGVLDVLAGPLVSGWLGVAGVLLVGVASLGLGRDLLGPVPVVDRAVVGAARRLQAAVGNDSDAAAAVAPVGALGARVVVFTAEGRLADVVVRDVARGELAAQVAGVETVPSAELRPPLRTG